MRTVLILAEHYLPGFKGGGPIRSLANLVESLGNEYRFRILTRDRDLGENIPYPGLPLREWVRIGKAEAYYAPTTAYSLSALSVLLRREVHDALYINGLYARDLSIRPLMLRRLGRLSPVKVIVAPRGMLAPGSLEIKRARKTLFLNLARTFRLYKDVCWHASCGHEADQIRQWFGSGASIHVVPNFSAAPAALTGARAKVAGVLRVVYLSRIAPNKNLRFAFRLLNGVQGQVSFSIFGPVIDEAYWKECRQMIRALPGHAAVQYGGAVRPDQVPQIMAAHHLLLLPTTGENHGHVILEALQAGCPVLISDCTPWRALEAQKAGWDLPLNRPDLFREVLQRCINMDTPAYARWSEGAGALARRHAPAEDTCEGYRRLFSAECPRQSFHSSLLRRQPG